MAAVGGQQEIGTAVSDQDGECISMLPGGPTTATGEREKLCVGPAEVCGPCREEGALPGGSPEGEVSQEKWRAKRAERAKRALGGGKPSCTPGGWWSATQTSAWRGAILQGTQAEQHNSQNRLRRKGTLGPKRLDRVHQYTILNLGSESTLKFRPSAGPT